MCPALGIPCATGLVGRPVRLGRKSHTDLQLQATGRDLLRRGCGARPEVVHLDRRPVPRGWLVARRRGAALARDAFALLRLLFGVLAVLVLGIVLGVIGRELRESRAALRARTE